MFLLCLEGRLEGALARTSEVPGPGVQCPGGLGSGSRKGEDIDKEAGSMAQREVCTWRTKAGPARGQPAPLIPPPPPPPPPTPPPTHPGTVRAHRGRVLTDWT